MKVLFSTMLFLGPVAASAATVTQQGVAKPVLSANPAAAPDGPATQPTAPGDVPATYLIGSNDSIQVTVWHEPQLSGSFPVRPDGMISIPLVGDVMAAGHTPMDLAHDLSIRLKKFINDPNVNITVLAINSKRIFLLGQVGRIGALPLTGDMTPLQAIAAAGGLTEYAKKSQIYILRTEQGKQKIIHFNYKKAIKTGNQQGVTLMSGDTIVVP